MPLLEARKQYKPFEYPWAFEYWKRQQQIHWMPEEVPLGEDCRDWAQKLTNHERNLLTQIFRFFTQADVEVQDCYHDKYGRVFKPTEIKMMLTAFSNMETVHIAAYSHLLDTIGMPESEYSACSSSASIPTRTSPRLSPCSAASPRGFSCSAASRC
jgi:ribonucleoside-diphosphate reductase beta chain